MSKPRYRLRDGKLELVPNPLPQLHDYEQLLANEPSVMSRLTENDSFVRCISWPQPIDILASVRLWKVARTSWKRYQLEKNISVGAYCNTGSEGYQITERLLEAFYQEVLKHDALPIIVIFPTKEDLRQSHSENTLWYAPLLKELTTKDFEFLDLGEAFKQREVSRRAGKFFSDDNIHYNAAGNWVVAQYVAEYMAGRGLLTDRGRWYE